MVSKCQTHQIISFNDINRPGFPLLMWDMCFKALFLIVSMATFVFLRTDLTVSNCKAWARLVISVPELFLLTWPWCPHRLCLDSYRGSVSMKIPKLLHPPPPCVPSHWWLTNDLPPTQGTFSPTPSIKNTSTKCSQTNPIWDYTPNQAFLSLTRPPVPMSGISLDHCAALCSWGKSQHQLSKHRQAGKPGYSPIRVDDIFLVSYLLGGTTTFLLRRFCVE